MASKYSISKERDGFSACNRKTGEILVTFDRRDQAADYIEAQKRADEQHAVMGAYNEADEARALLAEFLAYEV